MLVPIALSIFILAFFVKNMVGIAEHNGTELTSGPNLVSLFIFYHLSGFHYFLKKTFFTSLDTAGPSFFYSTGIFWKKNIQIPKNQVESIDFKQGPIANALGFGTIVIKGQKKSKIKFKFARAQDYRRLLA